MPAVERSSSPARFVGVGATLIDVDLQMNRWRSGLGPVMMPAVFSRARALCRWSRWLRCREQMAVKGTVELREWQLFSRVGLCCELQVNCTASEIWLRWWWLNCWLSELLP
ncbi:hypothetical protein M0R45_027922 [Rubus argutus]|uniref:Uncharacterized protein n=1 Tax=Rubus argutus TaxID=59490 RepID=A0AAW1W680_RUBAR